MMPSTANAIFFMLFNIYAIYAANPADFTAERRIDQNLLPLKLKDKTLFTYFTDNDTIITSFSYFSDNSTIEPGKVECTIPGIIPPERYLLGNGKVVAMTYVHSHFTILDYKNCSSYSTIPIDDGKPYAWDADKEVQLVVPYYDTFDVFDADGKDCLPCRYNDKGEKIEVKNKLMQAEKWHEGYFLEPTSKDAGPNGEYLYGFSFKNETAIAKILDSNYNVLKEHVIKGTILGRIITGDKFIICYNVPTGHGGTECEILNKDLSIHRSITMQRPLPTRSFDSTHLQITDFGDKGVMVAMNYVFFKIGSDNNHHVFMQQITAGGTIERAIHFANIKSDYVGIRNFVTKKGEYCLVAAVNHEGTGDYSVMKCVVPEKSE